MNLALLGLITAGIVVEPSIAHANDVIHQTFGSWQTTDFQNQLNPGCFIGANAESSAGRIIMGASQYRPNPVNLLLRIDGMAVPDGTIIQMQAIFPNRSILDLFGEKKGQNVQIELTDLVLDRWLQMLDSNPTGKIYFVGNGRILDFNLSGFHRALLGLHQCLNLQQTDILSSTLHTSLNALTNISVKNLKQSETSSILVTANSTSSKPQYLDSVDAGRVDRIAWEQWFGALAGDARDGAIYWASRRSLPHPGSCVFDNKSQSWLDACREAQQRLSPIDNRRLTDPEYRRGWNQFAAINARTSVPRPTKETAAEPSRTVNIGPASSPGQATKPTIFVSTNNSTGIAVNGGDASSNSHLVIWLGATGAVAAIFGIRRRSKLVKLREVKRIQKEQERRALAHEQWLDAALSIANSEIQKQAGRLRVRKLQTVQTDFYGTQNNTRWNNEKQIFHKSRIVPLLAKAEMLDAIPSILSAIMASIDEAADAAPVPLLNAKKLSNPEVFSANMHPLDYERHCALQLEAAGWQTTLTAISGDQGADIIAERNGKILVIQCKLHSTPVGNNAVQQVHAARTFQGADFSAVVSNQAYTKAARQLAKVNAVCLLHHDQLLTLTEKNLKECIS